MLTSVRLFALKLAIYFMTISSLSAQNCNHVQFLAPGVVYYVYNPDFPDASNGAQYCTWNTTSDYRVNLTCNIFDIDTHLFIPRFIYCYFNKLTVHVNEFSSKSYCGKQPFTVESTGNAMTIELSTAFWSWGTKFLCELQAIEKNDQPNCQCGRKNMKKIVGGEETGVNEYPMMAGLLDSRNNFTFCGATIISRRHVLTAAHCLTNKNMNDVRVFVGGHNTTGANINPENIYYVSRIDIHPLYNETTSKDDIAVVTVNTDINFSEKVGPACLPFQHQNDFFTDSDVDLLGWGLLGFADKKSDTLQKVTVSVTNKTYCSQFYENLSNGQLCTYGKDKDACQFDSGGPVLWQDPTTEQEVLVGIISAGTGCGGVEPGINTRVGYYIDWITNVTAGTDYCKTE